MLVSFAPSVCSGFVFDDLHLIRENQHAHAWSEIPGRFQAPLFDKGEPEEEAGARNYYRPLVFVSYIANWRVAGGEPWLFHATNVGLHLLNTWLAWRALRRWTGSLRLALLGALLFAVHPTRAESVVWISGRTDLMMTGAMLGAAECYRRMVKGATSLQRAGWALGTLGLLVCALLSKEQGFFTPLLLGVELCALGAQKTNGSGVRGAAAWGKVGLVVAVAVVLGYAVLRWYWVPFRPEGEASPILGLMTVGGYLARLVWPWPPGMYQYLVPLEHGIPVRNPVLLGIGALGVLGYLLGTGFFFRRDRTALLLWVGAGSLLAPVLNFQATRLGTVFDRFLYLPLLLALGALLRQVSRRHVTRSVWLGTAGVTVISLGLNWLRIPDFRDNRAFWERELELTPANARAQHSLGLAHLEVGDTAAAYEALTRHVEQGPRQYLHVGGPEDKLRRYALELSVAPALLPDGARPSLALVLAQIRHLVEGSAPPSPGWVLKTRLGVEVEAGLRDHIAESSELRAAGALLATRLGDDELGRRWLDQVSDERAGRLATPENFVLACARADRSDRARRLLASLREESARRDLLGRIERAEALRRSRVPRPERDLRLARAYAELGAYGRGLAVVERAHEAFPEHVGLGKLRVQLLVFSRRREEAVALAGQYLPRDRAEAVISGIEAQLPARVRALPVVSPRAASER